MTGDIESSPIIPEAFELSKTGSNVTSESCHLSDITSSDCSRSHGGAPPNVKEGGIWGTAKIRGFLMVGCAQKRDTYAVWGKMRDSKGNIIRGQQKDILLYDTEGNCLGPRKNFKWTPKPNA